MEFVRFDPADEPELEIDLDDHEDEGAITAESPNTGSGFRVLGFAEFDLDDHEDEGAITEISSSAHYIEAPSIYKLPTSITDLNKKAYSPQEVSFGPYHHGKEHLLPMEKHKERALQIFLKRSNKSPQSLVDSLAEEVKDLKSSYAMLPTEWEKDDDKFIRLMMLDGCFMLEILQIDQRRRKAYPDRDPIFSREGMIRMIPRMVRDMLMLENQLPMRVLEKLLALESQQQDNEHLNKLILEFTGHSKTVVVPADQDSPDLGKCLHVLDVYRKNLLKGEQSQRGARGEKRVTRNHIPSATELYMAGIRFRKSENASLGDISFNGGTLKLPPISVHDNTESMFLNMIAYERYHIGTGNPDITSYIYFMAYNIVTEKDVALLTSGEIVQHCMGSDKAVAELFQSLFKDLPMDPDSKLTEVLDNVQKQYYKSLNVWRKKLNRTVEYFRNRWAFLSLVAAVCLFAIAITQTVYTICAYYKNDSPPTPPNVPHPPPPMISPPTPVISRRLSFYHHL